MAGSAKGRKAEEAKQLRESIRALTNSFRDWIEGAMWPQGMTVPQLRLLFAVHKEPEASSAAIARLCQVTPQTLQAMMQRAEREGWLVRRPAEHNARVLVSALTTKGQTLLDRAQDLVTEFEAQVWRDASVADLRAINAAFANALSRVEQAQAARPEQVKVTKNPRAKPNATAKR